MPSSLLGDGAGEEEAKTLKSAQWLAPSASPAQARVVGARGFCSARLGGVGHGQLGVRLFSQALPRFREGVAGPHGTHT